MPDDGTRKVLGHKISHVYDPNNLPSKIIFREVTLIPCGTFLDVRYVNTNLQPLNGNIDNFISNLKSYPNTVEPTCAVNVFGDPVPLVSSPLDINCKIDCFIVFYLSSNWNWQFVSEGNGFTTKEDKLGKYGNLAHVPKNSQQDVLGDQAIGEDCRLLYLRAKGTPNYPSGFDGFNLHVELKLGKFNNPVTGQVEDRRTKIVIDPDIRNPGGSGDA